jgi:hypothetical protein
MSCGSINRRYGGTEDVDAKPSEIAAQTPPLDKRQRLRYIIGSVTGAVPQEKSLLREVRDPTAGYG